MEKFIVPEKSGVPAYTPTYKKELNSLLILKFQTLTTYQFLMTSPMKAGKG